MKPLNAASTRRAILTGYSKTLPGNEMMNHTFAALDTAEGIKRAVAEVAVTLAESKQYSETGIRAQLQKVIAPQLAQLKNLRAENARRAQSLLTVKGDGKVPDITDTELSILVQEYREASRPQRDSMVAQALGGQNPKLAAAMVKNKWAFGVTEHTRAQLEQRFISGATPQLDPEQLALVGAAHTLEEHLSELEEELSAATQPEAQKETDLQRAQRMAKEMNP